MSRYYELGKAAALDFSQAFWMPRGNEAVSALTKGTPYPATPGPAGGLKPPTLHPPVAKPPVPSGSSAVGWEPTAPKPPMKPPMSPPPAQPATAPAAFTPPDPVGVRHANGQSLSSAAVRGMTGAAPSVVGAGRVLRGAAGLGGATIGNAALEGLDLVGGLPQWAGGKGLGQPGLTPSREFLGETRPDGTVFGVKDPTGGALSYAGGAYNAWARPVRSTYELGNQSLGTIDQWRRNSQLEDKTQRMQQQDPMAIARQVGDIQ